MDYGAAICEIDGNFDDCMRLIQELADEPSIYVANSINPFRIEGQKTVAFEILEQVDWHIPDQWSFREAISAIVPRSAKASPK